MSSKNGSLEPVRFFQFWTHYIDSAWKRSRGGATGGQCAPPQGSLEPIFLGHLEVVLWEIDG